MHARERERDLAGAARLPVLAPRGLGAEDWTLVPAAQNEQVHGALLRYGSLDPHVHRASHGVVDQLAGATRIDARADARGW